MDENKPDNLKYLLSLLLSIFSVLAITFQRGSSYVGIALLLTAIAIVISNHRQSFKYSGNELYIIAGLFIYSIAGIAAFIASKGIENIGDANEHGVFLLAIPIFLAICVKGLNVRWLYMGIFAGAFSAGLLGIYQKYYLGQDVAHGMHWKTIFGNTSLILGAISLTYLIKDDYDRRATILKKIALLAFIMGVLGSLCSGTRGGWIALPFLLWLIYSRMITSAQIKLGIYTLAGAILITTYTANDFVNNKVNKAVDEVAYYMTAQNPDGHSSVTSRFEMWRGAIMMFQESPLSGIGYKKFGPALSELRERGEIKTLEAHKEFHNHAHSDILNTTAEQGLIGLVSLLALYIGTTFFFIKNYKFNPRLATVGLVLNLGFIIFGLTDTVLQSSLTSKFYVVMLAAFAGQLSFERRMIFKVKS